MLTNGDLVRLPQDCRVFSSGDERFVISKLKEPKIGIVLKAGVAKTTVLVEEGTWTVETKDIQLYGGKNVC